MSHVGVKVEDNNNTKHIWFLSPFTTHAFMVQYSTYCIPVV